MDKIDRQAQKYNAAMRQIYTFPRRDFGDYLNEYSGNMVITGGLSERRREALLRTVSHYRSVSNEPVIIFSSDPKLKSRLIGLANAGTIGQLYVIDKQYNNYDFLCGMDFRLIKEFFVNVAISEKITEIAALSSYTEAILNALSEKAVPSLASLRAFLLYNDTSIAAATDNSYTADMIRNSAAGGVILRSLVASVFNAFGMLTSPKCETGFRISSALEAEAVLLIDYPQVYYDVFAQYFALELRAAGGSFSVIFDDDPMLNYPGMYECVNKLKQRENIDIILSYDNILSIETSDKDENINIMKNFPRHLIFFDGNMPFPDLQKLLSGYGQFDEMVAAHHKDDPPHLIITLLHGKGKGQIFHMKDRVTLQEYGDMDALLVGGSSPVIFLIKKLII